VKKLEDPPKNKLLVPKWLLILFAVLGISSIIAMATTEIDTHESYIITLILMTGLIICGIIMGVVKKKRE